MKRPRRSRIALALTAGLLAAGIALAACRRPEDRLGEERILLARISLDSRWSPCTSTGSGYCRTPEEVARSMETRHLRGEGTKERRSPLGMLLLQRGGERLDRIISQLEADARKAPGVADPLVDLAAAQLTAGWAQGSAGRFVDALETADRALAIEPASSRACFNRAFALEELGLRDLARSGWERCERLETEPEWRDEAGRRAEALRVRPAPTRTASAAALDAAIGRGRPDELARWARDRPHLATDLVARDLLPRWTEAGPIAEAGWWPGLERLAEGVRQSTGDRLLSDVVRQMGIAVAEGSGAEVAEGIRRLRQGLDAYRQREFEEAAVRLRESGRSLGKVPALGMVARIYGAVSLHSSNRTGEAAEELSRIVAEAGERGYFWPLGYAHWTLGRVSMAEGRPLAALDHHRQAIQAFERIRADELVLSVRVMMAEAYSDLGQPEPAWNSVRRALLSAHHLGDEDRLFFVLNLLAGVAGEQGRTSLALYAETSAVAHSTREPPRSKANARLWRAFFLGREGRPEAAQAELRRAEELAREPADPTERARLDAELHLVRGVLDGQEDPESAAASFETSADLFRRLDDRFGRLFALKARAEALRRAGRDGPAVAALEEAMALYDDSVRRLAEGRGRGSEPDRLSFLRQNSAVYQTVIDLYVRELASPWKALLFAEHAKSLWAPGRPPEVGEPADAVERWSRALPPETAFVSYAQAGERVVAWVLTPAGRRFFPLGNAGEIAALVHGLDRAGDAAAWEGLSRELYRRLIGPLEPMLRGQERLLIAPSPGIDRVPFAGLLDPRSGLYLAESHLLEMLPSAASLLRVEGPPGRPVRRALVVGDPKPTRAGVLGLGPLRFAEGEAREAAKALGPGSELLLGPDATPGRFRELAAGAEVIHVAGHALSLGRGLDSAALVLAVGEGDPEGLLSARDILDLPLAGTGLVVLSACSSAGGAAVSWQSGLTLARSFLSAGADRVVATLHAVDDEESAKLFEAFYRELAAGKGAAASLRSAQREVLRWRSGTETWTPPSWPYVIILASRPSK